MISAADMVLTGTPSSSSWLPIAAMISAISDHIHSHVVEDSKGHGRAGDRVVDAVHGVADVVHISGDLPQLNLALRQSHLLEDVARDAAHDTHVPLTVLGVAHCLHHFVRAFDQRLDFVIRLDLFDGDQAVVLGDVSFHTLALPYSI